MRIGLTRSMFPFVAGLLLSRIAKPAYALLICSLLVVLVLYMPRIGRTEHVWMNGIYEAICIIIIFPLIVSYPLYLVHYSLVHFYVAWISDNKGITIAEAWLFSLFILIVSIVLAYAALKWYDEPVRKWLKKMISLETGIKV